MKVSTKNTCRLRLVCALAVVSLSAPAVEGGVYRWVDEQGRVHFADRAPVGTAEDVEIRPTRQPSAPGATDVERARKRQRLLEMYREDREAKKQAAKKRQEAKRQGAVKCRRAQLDLERYRSAGGIYDRVEGGERRYLSFQERERYIGELRRKVSRWCRED